MQNHTKSFNKNFFFKFEKLTRSKMKSIVKFIFQSISIQFGIQIKISYSQKDSYESNFFIFLPFGNNGEMQ